MRHKTYEINLQIMSELRIIKVLKFTIGILLMLTSAIASTPTKIRKYTILEGDNLLVICNVTENPDIEVFWTKNDTKRAFMKVGKRLEILNINRKYSGEYICHTLNTSNPVQDYNETGVNKTVQVIKVDVQYPGEIDLFHLGPDELMENQTFSVSCDFQANPEPVWSIRNRDTGNAMVIATGSASATLTSAPARCDDSGYWECTGRNALNNGVNVTRGHHVTIFCSPRPQYGKNKYVVQAKVGHFAQLKMYAQAYPHPIYRWYKDDGTDILNYAIQSDHLYESTLTFPTMSALYFGNYTLIMENGFGTNYAHYQLVADGTPETPTNLQFSDVTYDSVNLQWTSGFDKGSRQYFIVMKLIGNQFIQISNNIYDTSSNHGINQHWTYVLDGLLSDTEYNLTVVSRNERGFMSDFAKPSIAFKTRAYPPSMFDNNSNTHVKLILGITLGTLGAIGVLAFIVYLVKYRRMRTSYNTNSEKKSIF